MNPLARLGLASRRGFGRVTPDPFVLAVALSVLVLLAALAFGDLGAPGGRIATLLALLEAWSGQGLWKLLAFAMQACLMLVLGTALAEAPPVQRALRGLVGLARSPRGLVGLVALGSIGLALLNWSLSLIGGALLAREAGRRARSSEWKLHYPILCAAAYAGLMVWHGGLSGTAPLKATTMGDLVEVLGESMAARVGVLSLDRTLLSSLNLRVSGGLLVLGPLLFMGLTPADGSDPDPRAAPPAEERREREPPPEDAVERIERSPVVTWLLAAPMVLALAVYFGRHGLASLDLNTVNLILWALAMLGHGGPRPFLAAVDRGVRGTAGIMLQFPLYAGIMGIMKVSGLSAGLTELVAGAGASGLQLVTFASAGLVNLFVPSGGGQWAVQGPIIMDAALRTGVPPERVLMAMAYGDQLTNMLQPFWALPLLAITGVRARDIVGYTVIWMVAGGIWIALNLLL